MTELTAPISIAIVSELTNRKPAHALVLNCDLVIVPVDDVITVFYGRCLHRGALLSDGFIQGQNLVCGLHHWDYRVDTGVSEYNNSECLTQFRSIVEGGHLYVDEIEIRRFLETHPQPFRRDEYLGSYADTHPEAPEPYTGFIQQLAKDGLEGVGHHGPTSAMGVERDRLPTWEDIQFLPAQLARKPLLDDDPVSTTVIIGPNAKKPLTLKIPLFVSDMSFGALSKEAKVTLAKGAEAAGTGICSGEGGMLPDEQTANQRYFYELASAKFGFDWELMTRVQAFHFKGGQGAKTGTGGHLPGHKVSEDIAVVRGLNPGTPAISPSTFPDLRTPTDFAEIANQVRERSGGIPIGFKLAASRIEADIDFAIEAGADYIILDGRGGGTGAAPLILRDHINVPTIPALARARHHLDQLDRKDITLIITGGLRTPADFAKALMLGADAVAVSNAALQAIGCMGMRACHTNNCPVGIATQKPHLRARLDIDQSATQLTRFFESATELMKVIARACGYSDVNQFNPSDLSTFDRDMHFLTGIQYAGVQWKTVL